MKSLAVTAADFQVSVDISLLAQGYMDIASLTDLTTATGGTLYQYTPFNPVMDHDQVRIWAEAGWKLGGSWTEVGWSWQMER